MADDAAAAKEDPVHKLQHEWSIWEHRKQAKGKQHDYANAMHRLCTFGTVEDFWRYHNSIPSPSKIFFDDALGFKQFVDGRRVDGLSMFKKGIRPEWEDSANIDGGEYMCRKVSHEPGAIQGGSCEPAAGPLPSQIAP